MKLIANSSPSELDAFIDFLYDGSEGYVYLAAKIPNDIKSWDQEFFHYPTEENKLKRAIRVAQKTREVYIAPALFIEQPGDPHAPDTPWKAKKEQFKCTNVVWIDFDKNAPKEWESVGGPPSYIIQSSTSDRQHVYWRLNNPLTTVDEVQTITRTLAYNFTGADTGTWDATRVLRPPETFNHKRSCEVKVISNTNIRYDPDIFNSLPPIPETPNVESWQLSELPDTQDVILKYGFGPDLVALIKKTKTEVKDRSKALQQLAYGCCELGMSDNEVFVVLLFADDNWEKFKYRRDREKRLADIIVYARNKYPESEDEVSSEAILIWGYRQFLEAEIKLDWVAEGMLMENGNMLMGGKSGIGKTQFMLEFMKHIALGKDFLHYKVPSAKKVGLISLEMGHPDLQVFMRAQDKALTDEERDLLDQNLTIIPHGESWPLNLPVGQDNLKKLIDAYEWEGVFIDSIGSAVIGDISASQVVQPLTNFNDRIRKEFGVFLWYIHHIRKAQPGGNQRIDQDDFYGDQYLVNRASSGYILVPGKAGSIRVRNVKNRLAKQEHDYLIERTPDLGFKQIESAVPDASIILSDEDPPTTSPNGKFDL